MKPRSSYFSLKQASSIFIIMFLLWIGLSDPSWAEAAKLDRTAPTIPANLHITAVYQSTVSLEWTRSKDNKGVKSYDIYQNKKLVGSSASTKYSAKNLKPNTSYSFTIKARDLSGNVSAASRAVKVSTAKLVKDLPPQAGPLQVSSAGSDGRTVSGTVTLSVSAKDDKGISKVNFYSENGGYLIKSVTASPFSVKWATDPWVPDGKQVLKAIVYDTANQKVQTVKTVMVKNAPLQQGYKMVGYYTGWSTYSNYQVSNIDANKLTHLNYAFANISQDGKIALGDPWADVNKPFPGDSADQPYKGNFYQLSKLKKQYPHLKTLISVGGWTWSERFSDVVLTEQSRSTFANSVLQFILKYDFDGVDLDWEYPVGGGEYDNVNRPEDKHNFTLLLKKIRETFDAQSEKDGKRYLLTIAGGSSTNYTANTELHLIRQYADYIQLMTYDIHGSWDSLTGLNAPLYRDPDSGFRYEWSVQDAVQTYIKKGVPANQIVLGVPFYGRVYHYAFPANSGLYQPYGGGGSALTFAEIQSNYINKNGFIRYWESDSKVPWLYNGSTLISYDDVESMGYKTAFIKSMGLGGAMMWELSQDSDEVLLTKIHSDLQR